MLCFLRCAAVFLFALFLSAGAGSQSFPNKPVHLVVPYAPGGAVDLVARSLGQGLQQGLGQSVVVDNRPGGGGSIGVDLVAKSAPDGYTLSVAAIGALTINVHLNRLPYDPLKDLAPVTVLATSPMIIGVNASTPVYSIKDLIDYVKARPGKVSYSSNGLGSLSFLSGELFKRMTGIDMVHVPYKGGAPAAVALASGEVSVGVTEPTSMLPHVRAGRVRALAVTDPKRSITVPEIPTVAESGVPGYETNSWIALFAPAGTPAEIINRLSTESARALKLSEVRERILKSGQEPVSNSPAEMARILRTDFEKWRSVIKDAGIKPD
ncbi:MAG: hypothetical protein A3H27_04440 [Acidobacteria bacterium RIFCSPLOWO2_02_FULL_59_13]|nr:MAG: hypothetical protein A3H27_04440 [Acidobacteria bacterium RIFCSPLOWO2_02_FULL_59_13]